VTALPALKDASPSLRRKIRKALQIMNDLQEIAALLCLTVLEKHDREGAARYWILDALNQRDDQRRHEGRAGRGDVQHESRVGYRLVRGFALRDTEGDPRTIGRHILAQGWPVREESASAWAEEADRLQASIAIYDRWSPKRRKRMAAGEAICRDEAKNAQRAEAERRKWLVAIARVREAIGDIPRKSRRRSALDVLAEAETVAYEEAHQRALARQREAKLLMARQRQRVPPGVVLGTYWPTADRPKCGGTSRDDEKKAQRAAAGAGLAGRVVMKGRSRRRKGKK